MADNLTDRGARDRARINVNQPHELRYSAHKLGVSEDDVKRAVEQVGPMALPKHQRSAEGPDRSIQRAPEARLLGSVQQRLQRVWRR